MSIVRVSLVSGEFVREVLVSFVPDRMVDEVVDKVFKLNQAHLEAGRLVALHIF